MIIRLFEIKDLSQIKSLISSLHPKWFDHNALNHIPIDIQLGTTYIAEENAKVRGFIAIASLEGVVWINWMGVDPQYHGHKIGTQLLLFVEKKLKDLGAKDVRVDTVIEQSPADGTYDKTVQFYLKNGFKVIKKHQIQTFKEFTYRRGILLKEI